MKTELIAILAIVALGSSMPFAFADVVPFPALSTEGWTGTSIVTEFPSNSTYNVVITVSYSISSPFDVPNSLTYNEHIGEYTVLYPNQSYMEKYYPVEEEELSEKEIQEILSEEQRMQRLAEKRLEMLESSENGFAKLRKCLVEFEEQEPVRFQGWMRIADLTEFTIPDAEIRQDHYDLAEFEAMKKWTICEALKQYQWIGAYAANRIMDSNERQSLVTTDDPRTQDITLHDLLEEQKRASEYACSNKGKLIGLCPREFTGENRGDPDGYMLPFFYGEWKEMNAQETDKTSSIDAAMLAQCENYYPQYAHKVGLSSFPKWLDHCVQ